MIISLRYRIATATVSPGGTLLCKLTAQRNSAGVVGKAGLYLRLMVLLSLCKALG